MGARTSRWWLSAERMSTFAKAHLKIRDVSLMQRVRRTRGIVVKMAQASCLIHANVAEHHLDSCSERTLALRSISFPESSIAVME